MSNCYVCGVLLNPQNQSREHVLPNSIGGRLTSTSLLCATCNNTFGNKYEAEFAKQLLVFSGRLPIKRARNKNPEFSTTDTNSGLPIILDDKGYAKLAHPVFEELPLPGKPGRFKARFPDEKSKQKFLDNLKRKHPKSQITIESEEQITSSRSSDSSIQIKGSLGGLEFFKTLCKSLLNLYIYHTGDIQSVAATIKNVFCTNDIPRANFYVLGKEEKPAIKLHHNLSIIACPERQLLFGYIELFGFVKILTIFNDTYSGPAHCYTYSIDPLSGNELQTKIQVEATREQIIQWVDNKEIDLEKLGQQWGLIEYSISTTHHHNKIIDDTFRETLFAPENLGKVITEEMIAKMTDVLIKKLMPDILRARENRAAKR